VKEEKTFIMVQSYLQTTRTHAIVIGGGMAGLLAARVLATHFEQVTLIERDHYPQEPAFRPGVPQGRQVHTTLLRGQRVLETFFPGLGTKLVARGAIERDYGNESLYYYGGRCPRIPPVLHGWNCSRLLLEWQIRQELGKYVQLQILEGYEVVHLLFDEERRSVNGVQFRVRNHHPHNAIQQMQADLVVDASGAASRTAHWLKELGYAAPKETVVNTYLGYATRFYEPPLHFRPPWKGIAIQGTEQRRRGGVLMEIEGGRWVVVLSGVGKDYPPTEPEAYLAFAQSLPDPSLYEAIKDARPISPIYGYRRTENCLRHFDRLRDQPEGLIVMGDAVCAFNPIYGQGITVAALQAQLLDTCLRSHQRPQGFARLFQRKVARLVVFPWQLAAASDARIAQKRKANRYIEYLIDLLPENQTVFLRFLEVVHMLRSPLALLYPTILAKVCARWVSGHLPLVFNKEHSM
jgi:2-polyprenyl-6-methoxyphenol hydroxylase-like FAD-dependent oxidoreductase